MPCTAIPGFGAIVCSRGRRARPKCKSCGWPASILCDFPVEGGTCDCPLCEACAVTAGPDLHHCPGHPATPATTREQLELGL